MSKNDSRVVNYDRRVFYNIGHFGCSSPFTKELHAQSRNIGNFIVSSYDC